MRPKSMATVVVTFWSTPSVSSTNWPASLSSSSVRSGLISLTAPTRVVLPTPNPPATSIFSARAVDSPPWASEFSETIDHFSREGRQRAATSARGREISIMTTRARLRAVRPLIARF